MTTRDDVLARIRFSLRSDAGAPTSVPRNYNTVGMHQPGARELVDLFEARLVDYKATVRRTTPTGIGGQVTAILAERARANACVVVPPGLDRRWVGAATFVVDDGAMTAAQLDETDAVLTACAVAIAETGTIVLDAAPDQGRRAISLLPDLHICVVRVEQIVENVPDALRLLDPSRPLTLISGGSATSDIELERVEGVHGPRNLVVLIVSGRGKRVSADQSGRVGAR